MKRFTAATLAAATALSLAVAPAHAAEPQPNNELESIRQGAELIKLAGILANKGTGAIPDTNGAGDMIVGSVQKGSSAEQAYNASQAGWALTWIAVAAAGLGAIAFIAQQAGLIPAGTLPF